MLVGWTSNESFSVFVNLALCLLELHCAAFKFFPLTAMFLGNLSLRFSNLQFVEAPG